MGFLKIKANQLFDGYRFHAGEILILQQNGAVEAIVPEKEAGDDLLELDGIVSPGFVNCHCHLELSHLKERIEEGTGLAHFVQDVVAKRRVGEDEIQQAIADAEQEMIENGIVAAGDICNTTGTIDVKAGGNLYYHSFIEVLGSDPAKAESNFEIFSTIHADFCRVLPGRQVSFTPHAPYSVSELLWEKILTGETKLMSIHNQEAADENLWFKNKTGAFVELYERMKLDTSSFIATGKSSLQSYLPKFRKEQSLILVHNVHTSEDDIHFAAQQPLNLFWCFCPNANEYISRQLPDIPLFINNNCTIVLGTDSLASNHQLSIWEEIKTIRKKFPQIELEQLLQWATLNGAKALQVDGRFGSFEKGKKPGVVHIDGLGNLSKVI